MKKHFVLTIESIPETGQQLQLEWDDISVEEILRTDVEEFKVCSPLNATLFCSLLGEKVIIEGTIELTLQFSCVSCLSEFTQPLVIAFRYILWPESNAGLEEDEKELHEEDMEVGYYQGETIDLRPLVREQIYLSLPQNPHCKNNCLGLCLHCGTNLNEMPCGCSLKATDSDSPFSALKKLKKD